MTHGGYGCLYSKNEYYKTEDIFEYFTDESCPTLKGKPRLFFIQACRGKNRDKMTTENNEIVPNSNQIETDITPSFNTPQLVDCIYDPFNHSDFLIVRSTIPNYVSYRHTKTGSWFIQTLCEVLDDNAKKQDLLSLLTHVNYLVSQFQSEENEKQILTISSMLTKVLKF